MDGQAAMVRYTGEVAMKNPICPRCGNEVEFICPITRLCSECVQSTVSVECMVDEVGKAANDKYGHPALGRCRCVYLPAKGDDDG